MDKTIHVYEFPYNMPRDEVKELLKKCTSEGIAGAFEMK